MNENTFPNLVKLFYTNFSFEGENMSLHVKGVDMEITPSVLNVVPRLKYPRVKFGKGNIRAIEDFNKRHYYISCLRNPLSQVKCFHVGTLKLDERIIAFITAWMLTPRGSNHVVLTEEDLVLVYCIMKKIKVNWIYVIKEHMLKSIRLSDYWFLYVILVSKFL